MAYRFDINDPVRLIGDHFAEGSVGKVLSRKHYRFLGNFYDVFIEDAFPKDDGRKTTVGEKHLEKVASN